MWESESDLPLWVEDGDILLIQKPFKDETLEDYVNLPDVDDLQINHIALITSKTLSHCISHSVTEGYSFPSCRNTKLWNGTYLVIRCKDKELADKAVAICRRWCSGVELIDKETYMKLYHHHRWSERRAKDLFKFQYTSLACNHCNIYSEPRATDDLRVVGRNPIIKSMSEKSMIRAIKFATRRDLSCKISKGFRCTPLIVAVWQAAILSTLIVPSEKVIKFKGIHSLEECKDFMVEGSDKTEAGQLLKQQEYEELFLHGAFAMDCRFAVPYDVFVSLQNSSEFSIIGMFSYFNKSLISEKEFPIENK